MFAVLPKLVDCYRSTLGHATVSAVLLWAALPPLDLWPLAWIAPAWWVMLVRREKLDARHPYRILWLVGFVFWLFVLHFLRLPHWSTCFAWILLTFYFAFYLPVFVGLSRVAVHRLRVPVVLAAPIVWTGLELAREYVLTGSTIASIGHTQYRWIELIQLSDLAGAYGVGFLVMLVASCAARMVPLEGRPAAFWPLLPAAAAVAAALGYGYFRTSGDYTLPGARIALIQGCIDSQMKADPGMNLVIQKHYFDLSEEAARKYDDLELIIWPETMFRSPVMIAGKTGRVPDDCQEVAEGTPWLMKAMAERFKTPLILGVDTYQYGEDRVRYFNSAQFVTRSRRRAHDYELAGRYDKMHLVLLGEYVPLAEHFPWLQKFTPLPVSLTPGKDPVVFELGPLRIAPNICFESFLPRVIRRQVNTLRAAGSEPNVLVNLTNDGWFHGSSELDLHLACGVFRAVECRMPLLIAANTGFSAWIDGDGRIRRRGRRHDTDIVLADVRLDRRTSWYLRYGHWLPGLCLAACGLFAAVGCQDLRKGDRYILPERPAGCFAQNVPVPFSLVALRYRARFTVTLGALDSRIQESCRPTSRASSSAAATWIMSRSSTAAALRPLSR